MHGRWRNQAVTSNQVTVYSPQVAYGYIATETGHLHICYWAGRCWIKQCRSCHQAIAIAMKHCKTALIRSSVIIYPYVRRIKPYISITIAYETMRPTISSITELNQVPSIANHSTGVIAITILCKINACSIQIWEFQFLNFPVTS